MSTASATARRLVVAAVPALVILAACGSGHHSTPVASPTPAPTTASPSPSPTAVARVAVYPLTGLPVTDTAKARRPALSVKIDNVAGSFPQTGLNQADLVTDILVEGGLTRLMATFQSQDAATVGPIRSARPVDADLLRELNGGIFAYSGADPREIAPVRGHSTALLVSNDADGRWFHRSPSRPVPHNVISSTQRLYEAGRTLRPKLAPPPQLFAYSAKPPTGGTSTHGVALTFSPFASAGWTWHGSSYLRTQNGSPDVLSEGSTVSAANVVVLSVGFSYTSIRDAAGNADPYVHVIGSGRCWVMRDGVVVKGTWTRPSYRVRMVLRDAAHHVIPLHPGRTWLELLPRPHQPSFS